MSDQKVFMYVFYLSAWPHYKVYNVFSILQINGGCVSVLNFICGVSRLFSDKHSSENAKIVHSSLLIEKQ
jgi:hypothetical protein